MGTKDSEGQMEEGQMNFISEKNRCKLVWMMYISPVPISTISPSLDFEVLLVYL